jgi:DNA repair exonuclease SbcCD ATPase subunit
MSSVCPVHIILGNHDGLISNMDRQDAISPIISALDSSKIHLYKKSGVYPTGVPGFNWCVFSCFDEEGWNKVVPVAGDINIALYHGGVWGSKTDIDWAIEGEVDVEFFKNFQFSLLGDIHKVQFLDDKKTIGYCGSSIQQNYGEEPGKGFLLWDIKSADDFNVEFHEIPHTKPFVTIDWMGDVDSTLLKIDNYLPGSRFRIRSDKNIHQSDISILYSRLKRIKKPSEIVFKIDHSQDYEIVSAQGEVFSKKNLRDFSVHQKLMRSYYENSNISEKMWEKIEDKVSKYISSISRMDEVSRNIRWSINKIEFDNTFSYGKGNILDFNKLGGITGIFGKNRQGKSSIIGSLMYSLYNTTDRGGIKNLHIINTRKKHCKASTEINVNGSIYRVDRGTVKHQARKGHIYATTSLNISKIDKQGNIIEDMSGEQRRDTEKMLKKLIGTSEDFLLTSLASQGEMNTFIKEKATSRKNILSKFLDLQIFDQMFAMAKEDSSGIRVEAKNLPKIDWDSEIEKIISTIDKKREKVCEYESDLIKLRSNQQDLKIGLATSPDRDVVTKSDIDNQKSLIEKIDKKIKALKRNLLKLSEYIEISEDKIEKIQTVKSQFPISEIKEKIVDLRNARTDLLKLEHELDRQKTVLKNQEKSVKKLEDIPCGDKFPTCKFIKDSYKNKTKIEDQRQLISILSTQVRDSKKYIRNLEKENLEENIKKYDTLIKRESNLSVEVSSKKIELHNLESDITSFLKRHDELNEDLSKMEIHVVDDDSDNAALKIKKRLFEISSKITELDANRISLVEQIGSCETRLKGLKKEKKKSSDISSELHVYDLILQAVSKNGIPRQIMRSQLPNINSEISNILQGIMGFTVDLEADSESNSMDIFINYGDSRRIIELASGMEKMIASLAIRVALINVSSLPKTDLFIIDEGFGNLDENNIAACNRLLTSMKKWFKNILIISHVDGVKDVVDNVLDISSVGKDAKIVHI